MSDFHSLRGHWPRHLRLRAERCLLVATLLALVLAVSGCSSGDDGAQEPISSIALNVDSDPVLVERHDRLVARRVDARFEFRYDASTDERSVVITQGEADLFLARPRPR